MAEQTIPYPGKTRLRTEIASRDAAAEELAYEATVRRVAAEVKQAYFDLAYVDRSLAILEKDREALEGFEKVTEIRYSVGKAAQQDVLRAQLEVTRLIQRATMLDQRHRISLAGVYAPGLERLTRSGVGRALLSGWRLSSVMEFSSGRPYAAMLSPACTSSTLSFSNCDGANGNLNDTAFNQDTANTAAGINGGGPTPGIGLNSFYGPWLERIDLGLARSFEIREGKELEFRTEVFILFNHANYYVQNGDGINQLQYNPIGTNCGDGATLKQTCYLVPNSGRGILAPCRKLAPMAFPACCSFQFDSPSSRILKDPGLSFRGKQGIMGAVCLPRDILVPRLRHRNVNLDKGLQACR